LLLVAVQTGLRLSELTGLKLQDLTLGTGAHLCVIGKGRKERCVPLTKQTVAVLKMQNEYASLPDFALDAYAPAVRRDDVFDQAQPQSVAANLRRLRFFAAVERLKDALLLGWRDAKSAIRDSDLNLFAVGCLYQFGAQPDPTDHGQWRAQLVRDSGDELHLLRREPLGATAGQHYEADARAQQQQDAGADREVASERSSFARARLRSPAPASGIAARRAMAIAPAARARAPTSIIVFAAICVSSFLSWLVLRPSNVSHNSIMNTGRNRVNPVGAQI
jgi:Phage integrase family